MARLQALWLLPLEQATSVCVSFFRLYFLAFDLTPLPSAAALLFGVVAGIGCNLGTGFKALFGVDDCLDVRDAVLVDPN